SNEAPDATDDLDIPINSTSSLSVEKSSTNTEVNTVGQLVPYSYIVTNTGTITLTNVTLADNNTDAQPVCVPVQPATLAPNGTMACTAEHTVTQAEIDALGMVTNIATADSDETGPATDTLEIPVRVPAIGVAKQVTDVTETSPGTYEVSYEIFIENYAALIL
ncbi:MAG: hypothetical protein IH629_08195, partial [Thermoleophilia bacterium]|nr:hypothetical protein [Thermoleophilia bacterium]